MSASERTARRGPPASAVIAAAAFCLAAAAARADYYYFNQSPGKWTTPGYWNLSNGSASPTYPGHDNDSGFDTAVVGSSSGVTSGTVTLSSALRVVELDLGATSGTAGTLVLGSGGALSVGVLRLGNTDTDGGGNGTINDSTTSGSLTVNGRVYLGSNSLLTVGANDDFSVVGLFSVGKGGTLDLAGRTKTLGELSITGGTVDLDGGALTVGSAGFSVSGSTSAVMRTNNGTIDSDNTLLSNAATLQLAVGDRISGTLQINSGASLDLNGVDTTLFEAILDGTNSTLTHGSGTAASLTTTTDFTVENQASFAVGAKDDFHSAQVVVQDGGTFDLNGHVLVANDLSLQLNPSTSLPNLVRDGGTLNLANAHVSNGATLTFAQGDAVSNALSINAATADLAGAALTVGGSVTVADGGNFVHNGGRLTTPSLTVRGKDNAGNFSRFAVGPADVITDASIASGGSVSAGSGETRNDTAGNGTITGTTTLNGGGRYAWKLVNTTGAAGVDWDKLTLNTLSLDASSSSRFTILVGNGSTTAGGTPTTPTPAVGQRFVILSDKNLTQADLAAVLDDFMVDASQFDSGTSRFTLSAVPDGSGSDLALTYNGETSSQPEPATTALVGLGSAGVLVQRRRARHSPA